MSWKPSSVANPPNKMRTLILIPTETEAAPLRAACPDAPVRIAGVGMAATAAATGRVIAEGHPGPLILAGIALFSGSRKVSARLPAFGMTARSWSRVIDASPKDTQSGSPSGPT